MAKVQPVDVALLGTINTLTVKYLTGDAEDVTTGLYYELSEVTEVTEEVEGQPVTTSNTSKTISVGNYYMSEEEFAAWGQDNSYLLHLVADHLGLTLI
jgi:hypothetical protein